MPIPQVTELTKILAALLLDDGWKIGTGEPNIIALFMPPSLPKHKRPRTGEQMYDFMLTLFARAGYKQTTTLEFLFYDSIGDAEAIGGIVLVPKDVN